MPNGKYIRNFYKNIMIQEFKSCKYAGFSAKKIKFVTLFNILIIFLNKKSIVIFICLFNNNKRQLNRYKLTVAH